MARPASPTYLSLRLQRLIPPALFIAPAAVALILTMAAPMAAAVLLSLQHWNGMAPPKWAGFSNYLNLIQDETFLRALWHTAYFTAYPCFLSATAVDRTTESEEFARTAKRAPYTIASRDGV